MVTTRIDSNQLLQVYQPETNAWTQAVTPVQINGGLDVDLVGSQAVALQQIAASVQNLNDILTQIRVGNTFNSSISTKAQILVDALVGTANGCLGVIAQKATTIDVHQSVIEQKLDSLISGGNTQGAKTDVLTTAVNNQSTTAIVISLVKFLVADQQYPVVLPSGTKSIRFRSRKIALAFTDIRYAFVNNQVNNVVGGNYSTLAGGNEFKQDSLNLTSVTLYLSATSTTAIAEVEVYS